MYLQIAVAALATAIGAYALAVARAAVIAPAVHRAGWRLTGMLMLVLGVDGLLQSTFGSWAILSGVGTPVWTAYLRWAPAFNYSRSGPEFAFAGILLHLAWRRRVGPRHTARGGALLVAGALAGVLFGWLEGPLQSELHYQRIAILDGALIAAWSMAMSAAVLADTVDRPLLAALVLRAMPLPLNVIWFSWLARIDTGVWVPRPFDMQLYHVVLNALVLALVLRRWRAARLGIPVQGLGGIVG